MAEITMSLFFIDSSLNNSRFHHHFVTEDEHTILNIYEMCSIFVVHSGIFHQFSTPKAAHTGRTSFLMTYFR